MKKILIATAITIGFFAVLLLLGSALRYIPYFGIYTLLTLFVILIWIVIYTSL